jgi:hypothetical protein
MGAETAAVEAGGVLEELLAAAACVFLALNKFHKVEVAQMAPNILHHDARMTSVRVVVGVRGTAADHSSLVGAVRVAGDRDRRAGSHCHNHMNTKKGGILPSCRLAAAWGGMKQLILSTW